MSNLDYGVPTATTSTDIYDNDNDDDNFFSDVVSQEVDKTCVQKSPNLDKLIKNPFFVSLTDGVVNQMEDKELFTKYKRVIILCSDSVSQIESDSSNNIFEKFLDKKSYEELAKEFTLITCTNKLLKNRMHRNQANIIDRNFLIAFNHHNLYLDNDEIVISLPTLSEEDVKLYCQLYENSNTLDQLIKLKSMYVFFNCDTYRTHILKRLSDITSHLKESEYWENPYNCKMNMTSQFKERSFRYKDTENTEGVNTQVVAKNSGIQDPQIKTLFDKLMTEKKGADYLQFIYKKDNFTDASSAAKENDFKLYRVSNSSDNIYRDDEIITYEKVTELFRITATERELYDLFNMFLLSKTHCHYVLNNSDVLDLMQPIISKYLPIYKYVLGYAWLCMYLEECIHKTRTLYTNRYVFTIDTASRLPVFPYCSEDIHMNPYCSLLVSSAIINSSQNCHSLAMIENYKDYGIDNLEGFKKKFNIFTTGSSNKCLFDGLEKDDKGRWKSFAIGGSIIPSCAEKKSPLMDTITIPTQDYDSRWNRFFNEYHADSDIDMMCNEELVFDFMDKANDLVKIITTNLNTYNGKDVSDSITIEPIKSAAIIINSKYLSLCMDGSTSMAADDIIKNIATPEIKELFHEKYTQIKFKNNRIHRSMYNNRKNPLYEHFYKMSQVDDLNIVLVSYEIDKNSHRRSDCETCIYLNDVLPDGEKVSNEKNIMILKVSESIKFKIRSPYMNHSIELFRTKYKEFFSCVSRFHLPCVRAYYDGNNVYMLPSCVTALLTHTNIDYKYFAGIRDPIEIINKYRMRGFGTIINDNEKVHMVEYNGTINKWGNMFLIDLKNKQGIKDHFGAKELNNSMFKPGKFMQHFPDDSYRNVAGLKYIKTVDDLYAMYKTQTKYDAKQSMLDLLKLKTINPDGSVEPFKPWTLEAGYEILNQTLTPSKTL